MYMYLYVSILSRMCLDDQKNMKSVMTLRNVKKNWGNQRILEWRENERFVQVHTIGWQKSEINEIGPSQQDYQT